MSQWLHGVKLTTSFYMKKHPPHNIGYQYLYNAKKLNYVYRTPSFA